jgi:branched-chain amino acid transport system ATP-binding protein
VTEPVSDPQAKIKLLCRAASPRAANSKWALPTRPDLILLDEPSMGLTPIIVEEIFEIVTALNRSKGSSFLIADQNIAVSFRHAHRGYVLGGGRVALEGSAADLLAHKDLPEIYLSKLAAS